MACCLKNFDVLGVDNFSDYYFIIYRIITSCAVSLGDLWNTSSAAQCQSMGSFWWYCIVTQLHFLTCLLGQRWIHPLCCQSSFPLGSQVLMESMIQGCADEALNTILYHFYQHLDETAGSWVQHNGIDQSLCSSFTCYFSGVL